MKRIICLAVLILMLFSFSACSGKTVEWNGEVENMVELFMVFDISNPYEYVGMADYVFVGTVESIEKIVIPEKITQHEDYYSTYRIHVDDNLKGELVDSITCSKMGGLKEDGTMFLVAAETSSGEMIMDTGLPEVGVKYVFMAYAQPNGSLTLSEIFDNREYNEDLLLEYTDYVENEIPYDRQRFISTYAK